MTLPDVVYIVRPASVFEKPGDTHAELRYSLRSVEANFPHDVIRVAGSIPEWIDFTVGEIPVEPLEEKFANQRQTLERICATPEVSDTFWLFNDDHFVVEPIAEDPPIVHSGPWDDWYIQLESGPKNTWRQAVTLTAEWVWERLEDEHLAYEAHVPLLFDKARLGAVLAEYPVDRRFAVGVTYQLTGAGGEGRKVGNAKAGIGGEDQLLKKLALDMPYLSTSDESFRDGEVGKYIRGLFPYPSSFERTEIAA